MEFQHHWIPMGFLQESFGMSMIFLPSSDYQISEGPLWELTRISIVFSWYVHGIPMEFLLDVHEVSMESLWPFLW